MEALQEQLAAEIIEPILIIPPHEDSIRCVAWLLDDRIVTGSDVGIVRIWNWRTSTQEGTSMVHGSEVMGIVTTKDGRIISFTNEGNHPMIWNVETQELLDGPWSKEDYGHVWSIVLSNSEELLASCHDKWIVLWDLVGTIQFKSSINLESIGFSGIGQSSFGCFSPDGKRLACELTPDVNKWMIVVLDVESGEPILEPLGAEGFMIRSVVWALDGARLACGCEDGNIRFIDSHTGETIGEPWRGHEDCVCGLSLSLDGKWLVSYAVDHTIRRWNVESSNLVGGPRYHLRYDAYPSQVAFSRSGEFIACVKISGSVSVLRVPWWDDIHQKAFDPLLDLSAVVSPDSGPSNGPRESDLPFLDVSVPRPRRSGVNPSDDTPRMQSSARSWRWWKKIPRLVFDRSNPIHMAWGPSRVHVASRDDVHNSPSPPARRTDDAYPAESNSGGSSDESTSDTPTDDLEVSGVGCCGLLSRPRTRATPGQRAVPVGSSAVTTHPLDANTLITTPSRPVPPDISELSAVVRSSGTT